MSEYGVVSAETMENHNSNSALNTQHSTMGGRSSVVESQPSKLAVVGSIPTARSKPSSLDPECWRWAREEKLRSGSPRSSVGRARPW